MYIFWNEILSIVFNDMKIVYRLFKQNIFIVTIVIEKLRK